MTSLTTLPTDAAAIVERVIMQGDLSRLSAADKVQYYRSVCESVGLNPLTKPFDYLKLSGKEVLYATKGAAEQLRQIHRISVTIASRELVGDVYVVTARAERIGDGRVDESTGAVSVAGLKGEQMANAYMKAETKAKRRVTLSICGLNMLDETEVDSIPTAERARPEAPAQRQIAPPKTQRIAERLKAPKVDASEVLSAIESAKTMDELAAAAEKAKALDGASLDNARKAYRERVAQLEQSKAAAQPAVTIDATLEYVEPQESWNDE